MGAYSVHSNYTRMQRNFLSTTLDNGFIMLVNEVIKLLFELHTRAYLRGGGFRGFKPPPPEIFIFFLKSEGKEIERK